MKELDKVVVLIPSLNPDNKLITYVNELYKNGLKQIIIINDGSAKEYDKYYDAIKDKCTLLKHNLNKGKGAALKTGFDYYLKNYKDAVGVITADSDGQHTVKDTISLAKTLINNPHSFIIGTRNFNNPNVPSRSKFGNKITSVIFKLLYGKKITDTQTGLRAIPNAFIEKIICLSGNKFEYEINVLVEATKINIDIKEVTIETIYIEQNKSSHFNPIKDSFKIYKVMFMPFLKFLISGLLSALIDIMLFTLFIYIFKNTVNIESYILLSTTCARIVSSLFNYLVNKNIVFNNNKSFITIIKYYLLVIIQMLTSALCVTILFKLTSMNETICKIIIDAILFFISYHIQRLIVFKGDNNV